MFVCSFSWEYQACGSLSSYCCRCTTTCDLHALLSFGDALAVNTIAADIVPQVFSQLADLHQGAVTFVKVSMGCEFASYQA